MIATISSNTAERDALVEMNARVSTGSVCSRNERLAETHTEKERVEEEGTRTKGERRGMGIKIGCVSSQRNII